MRKTVVATIMIVGSVLVTGCSEEKASSGGQDKAERQGDAPKKAKVHNQKPTTVVVNKGMSEKEEDKLKQRLDDLEDAVKNQKEVAGDHSTEQPTQESVSAEASALAAAQDYYSAAGVELLRFRGRVVSTPQPLLPL